MQNDVHDHRAIASRQGLLHFQEEAPGMVFWHPRGYELFRALEGALERVFALGAYQRVRTPQLLRLPLWQASGHAQHFAENMFFVDDETVPSALKPVSCPGHLEIVRRLMPSYRELPLRIGELGLVHRNEPSGTLHGLFRLRQFTQDDGHIFCENSQVSAEVKSFCEALKRFYEGLGFASFGVAFATRPADRAGSDAAWDEAEAMLAEAARAAGLPFVESPGGGAFYGPKLEFSLRDRLGREWQCGTIQLDLVMPERFGVVYVDRDGRRRTPALLHRALVGSLERMLGILLEQHHGLLPAWLAPEQVAVLPLSERHDPIAQAFASSLRGAGLRARVASEGTLSKRLRDAHELGTPYAAILGDREIEDGSVMLRFRAEQRSLSSAQALAMLVDECRAP
jgi:threonyl-tRNA synthetase